MPLQDANPTPSFGGFGFRMYVCDSCWNSISTTISLLFDCEFVRVMSFAFNIGSVSDANKQAVIESNIVVLPVPLYPPTK